MCQGQRMFLRSAKRSPAGAGSPFHDFSRQAAQPMYIVVCSKCQDVYRPTNSEGPFWSAKRRPEMRPASTSKVAWCLISLGSHLAHLASGLGRRTAPYRYAEQGTARRERFNRLSIRGPPARHHDLVGARGSKFTECFETCHVSRPLKVLR